MKKAQSISINTIVVAAIALLVLVVMIAIFGGRIKIFGSEARSCANQGGIEGCYPSCSGIEKSDYSEHVPGNIYLSIPGTDCADKETAAGDKYTCCKLLIEGQGEDTNTNTNTQPQNAE